MQPKKLLRSLFLLTLGLLAVLLNPRFPIFSFSKVFADGIQSDPGLNNHYIKSASHRTYHRGKETFGEKAGIQCTSNSFDAICFPVFKNISTWVYFDLYHITDQGDNLMRCSGVHEPLAVDKLPLSVKLKELDLEVTMLQQHSNKLSKFDLFIVYKELSLTELGNDAIFACLGISFVFV